MIILHLLYTMVENEVVLSSGEFTLTI